MSIAASWLILAAFIIRPILKKAPKRVAVLIWALVAIRLVLPFSIKSPLSLVPSEKTVARAEEKGSAIILNSGFSFINSVFEAPPSNADIIPADNSAVNPMMPETSPKTSPSLLAGIVDNAGYIWAAGAAAMSLYCAVSFILLSRRVRGAEHYEANVYISSAADTAFVLGVVKPRIYLPKAAPSSWEYAVAHERAHIKRGDHIFKILGFAVLALHWFNPLVWLGYALLCRDIESACDEKVIASLDTDSRADYSQALLDCAAKRRSIAACPLAFGGTGTKKRIKDVLNYKKPAFLILLAALVLIAALAVFFLTGPMRKKDTKGEDAMTQNIPKLPERTLDELRTGYTKEQAAIDGCVVMEGSALRAGEKVWLDFYEASQAGVSTAVRVYKYYEESDDYFVSDISFDGEKYNRKTWDRDGDTDQWIFKDESFNYLVRSAYSVNGRSFEDYLLSDSAEVTAERYWARMLSSLSFHDDDDIYAHCRIALSIFRQEDETVLPLEQIKEGYSKEQAVKDGCVVMDGSELLAGEKIWLDFYKASQMGEPAAVRVYQYYEEPEDYFVSDISFNGEKYNRKMWDREGDTRQWIFKDDSFDYLVRSIDSVNGKEFVYYLLSDSAEVTAERYLSRIVSSVCPLFDDDIYANCTIALSIRRDNGIRMIPDAIYDEAYIDLDGDGTAEKCTLGFGPTSGLFTFTFTVYKDGVQVSRRIYCTDFLSAIGFFKDTTGAYRVVGLTQVGSIFQNMRPDTLDLYKSWRIVKDEHGYGLTTLNGEKSDDFYAWGNLG